MTATDLWGTAVPAWISALGGVAAAGVGAAAFVMSLRNSGGVRTLRDAANSPPEAQQRSPSKTTLAPDEAPSAEYTNSPVTWTAWNEQRTHYRLRNDSTHTGARATLTSFVDVTPGGDGAAFYGGSLPVDLGPGESIPFTIQRSFVSPSVTAIKLTWLDPDGTVRDRTLYI